MNLLIEALVVRAGIDRETARRVVIALRDYAHRLPSLLWDTKFGAANANGDKEVALPPALRFRLN
jgi:hypothetical protein